MTEKGIELAKGKCPYYKYLAYREGMGPHACDCCQHPKSTHIDHDCVGVDEKGCPLFDILVIDNVLGFDMDKEALDRISEFACPVCGCRVCWPVEIDDKKVMIKDPQGATLDRIPVKKFTLCCKCGVVRGRRY
jgi:hypothetical protein